MDEILQCSNCEGKTQHRVYLLHLNGQYGRSGGSPQAFNPTLYNDECYGKVCAVCGFVNLYMSGIKVFPINSEAPPPSKHLPDKFKVIYNEAGTVFSLSLRASAALIRYCLEILCTDLGGKGSDLKQKINNTIDKYRLHKDIRDAAHAIRTIGNSYLHPREINEFEDPIDVLNLFHFINLIAEQTYGMKDRLKQFQTIAPSDNGAKEQ